MAGQPLGQSWLQELCLQSLTNPRAGKEESREAHEALSCHQTRDIRSGGGDSLVFSAPELSWIRSSLRLREKPTPLQGRECDTSSKPGSEAPGAISILAQPWASSRESGSRCACRNVCRAPRRARLSSGGSLRRDPCPACFSTAQELLCRNQRDVGVGEIPAPTALWPHNGSSVSELPGNVILSFLWF